MNFLSELNYLNEALKEILFYPLAFSKSLATSGKFAEKYTIDCTTLFFFLRYWPISILCILQYLRRKMKKKIIFMGSQKESKCHAFYIPFFNPFAPPLRSHPSAIRSWFSTLYAIWLITYWFSCLLRKRVT